MYGSLTFVCLAAFIFRSLPRTLYTHRLTRRERRDKQLVAKLHLAAPSSVLAGTLIALRYVWIVLSLPSSLSGGWGNLSHMHIARRASFVHLWDEVNTTLFLHTFPQSPVQRPSFTGIMEDTHPPTDEDSSSALNVSSANITRTRGLNSFTATVEWGGC